MDFLETPNDDHGDPKKSPDSTHTNPIDTTPPFTVPTTVPTISTPTMPFVFQSLIPSVLPTVEPKQPMIISNHLPLIVGSKFNSVNSLIFFLGREQASSILADNSVTDYETFVKAHISDQIELLQNANMYTDRWKNIIDDKDTDVCCNPLQISAIQNKATYISMFLYQCQLP